MSSSETNLERQTRRHRAPLIGIAAVTLCAVIGGAVYLVSAADDAETQSGGVDTSNLPAVISVERVA